MLIRIDERVKALQNNMVTKDEFMAVKDAQASFVTQDQLAPVRMIAYAMVSSPMIILLGTIVMGALK